MEREFVYNWECPKCEEEFHAFVQDSDLAPLSVQIVEHFAEAHGMSEDEVRGWNPKERIYEGQIFSDIWQHHCSSVQLSGKPDELMIR